MKKKREHERRRAEMLPVVSFILVFTQLRRSLCAAVPSLISSLSACRRVILCGWPLPCHTHSGGNDLNDRHLMCKQERCLCSSLKSTFVLHSLRCSQPRVLFLITSLNLFVICIYYMYIYIQYMLHTALLRITQILKTPKPLSKGRQ